MSDQPVSVPMGPLAMHFKRRADFFEQEAYNMAVYLESQALNQVAASMIAETLPLKEDTTGTEPIEPYAPQTPSYVMAPEGTSATPVEDE